MSTGYGAAAQFAGSMMQAVAANQEQRSMFNTFRDELARQGVYGAEAYAQKFEPGVRTWGNANEDIGNAAQKRTDVYNDINNRPLVAGAEHTDKKASAILKSEAQNKGKVAGVGDWMNQQGYNMQRAQQGIDQVSNFSRGDAAVFPYKMWNAQHSQDELAFWGQLISSAGGGGGGIGSMFGGSPAMQSGYAPQGQMPYGGYGQVQGPNEGTGE